MQWIYNNVRHDCNSQVDKWSDHVDNRLEEKFLQGYFVLKYIRQYKSWPLPPVIINAEFAILLGMKEKLVGIPYYLIEGTHRVSYANRLYELSEIKGDSEMEIIEILKL